MSSKKHSTGRYRWHAFTHWANLGLLAVGAAATVAVGPLALLALIPLEAGALWIVPDLPNFRAAVDEELATADLYKERTYYMDQLWGLHPLPPKSLGERIAGLFTEREELGLDDRVMRRGSQSFCDYLEMRQIIVKLRELRQLRDVAIREHEFARFEQVINGYLRFMIACRALANAVANLDRGQLRAELQEVDSKLSKTTNPELRAVLGERKRLCRARLDRLPKLEATLELFRTRAETIVYQMRNIHSQVLADPGMNVNAYLDDMVERHEILSDPVGTLEAEHLLDDLMDAGAMVRKNAAAQSRKQGQ